MNFRTIPTILLCLLASNLAIASEQLGLELNVYNFDYTEELPAPLKSTERGVMPGFGIYYQFLPTSRTWFAKGQIDYTQANTTYDGSTWKGSPHISSTHTTFLNLEGISGLNLFSSPALKISTYTGLGFHSWGRGIGEVVDNVYSPREEYTWFYLPVGVRLNKTFGARWDLALDLSARLMFSGKMVVKFSNNFADMTDPVAKLGNKTGWKASLPMTYRLASTYGVTLTPWYQYSAIGESPEFEIVQAGKTITYAIEPSSTTQQYGSSVAAFLDF